MATRIDGFISNYVRVILDNPQVTDSDIRTLLEKTKEAFGLDMVFLRENDNYTYTLRNVFACGNYEVVSRNIQKVFLSKADYKRILTMYDADGLSEEALPGCNPKDAVLQYGLISQNTFYGCVGFRKVAPHTWSAEERRALTKLGRILFGYVTRKRLELERDKNYRNYLSFITEDTISGYYVNLVTGTCHGFKIVDYLQDTIPEWSDYNTILENYCASILDAGYARTLLSKFNYENLRKELNDGNSKVTIEYPRLFPNGTRWFRMTVYLIDTDDQGKALHVTTIIDDITDAVSRKEKGSYAFSMIERNYFMILTADVDTNRYAVIEGSKRNDLPQRELFGVYSEFIDWAEIHVVHPNDRDKFRKALSLDRLGIAFANGSKSAFVDMRAKTTHGYEWVRAECLPHENYAQGDHRFTVYFRDISEELGKQEESRCLISSLSSIYSTTFYIDLPKNEMTELSTDSEVHNLILTKEDAYTTMDRLVEVVVDPSHRELMHKFIDFHTLKRRIGSRKIISCEYRSVQRGWCRASFIPVQWNEDGEIVRVLYTVRIIDESKRKELETQVALKHAYDAAKKANSAKTVFFSRMSHDIRTPLNGIIGMTALATANIDNKERVRDSLAKITISSRHLLMLINEVLDISKIESGTITLAEEPFVLSELINNLLAMIQTNIREHKHELSVYVNDICHEDVLGDALRLQQIFTNVMGNAIKYTPDGGHIKVTVSEKPCYRAGFGLFEFVFEDNGVGISEEFQKRIFEPFTREDDTHVNKVSGTGLGMPIVKNIVNLMGGGIKLHSVKNEGTKITISLYLKLQKEQPTDYEELRGMKVLAVDDDPFVCISAYDVFKHLNMKGYTADSGEEAIKMIKEAHAAGDDFQAIILDWKMPKMDGLAVTRAIREEISDKLPIVVLSSYDWSDIERDARSAGVNGFISKPIFQKGLAHKLLQLLHGENDESVVSIKEKLNQMTFEDKCVLVVEDHEINREISVELLSLVGVKAESAENGKEALEKVAASPEGYYDLIFMDVQMPVMDGYEATKAIRKLDRKDVKDIPIIAMTGNAFAEDVEEALKAGMNEHLSKPVDMDKFKKALVHWLDKK